MKFPAELKYTKDHEWAQVSGQTITVGITDHAQSALGDVVYLDLPKVGRILKKGETFGVVESIKAVSDLYSPISGKVTAINEALVGTPDLVNKEPYTSAWMVKIESSNASEMSDMMDAAAYMKFVESLS